VHGTSSRRFTPDRLTPVEPEQAHYGSPHPTAAKHMRGNEPGALQAADWLATNYLRLWS
jgi:hypothetical protein